MERADFDSNWDIQTLEFSSRGIISCHFRMVWMVKLREVCCLKMEEISDLNYVIVCSYGIWNYWVVGVYFIRWVVFPSLVRVKSYSDVMVRRHWTKGMAQKLPPKFGSCQILRCSYNWITMGVGLSILCMYQLTGESWGKCCGQGIGGHLDSVGQLMTRPWSTSYPLSSHGDLTC